MKEHMARYIDAHYIFLEQHYGTWDPHLCRWGRFDIILDACVYGAHDYIITWMYKNFLDPLYLLYVKLYDVVMYFNDLSFVLMMFGRVQYKQWDICITWVNFGENKQYGILSHHLIW